MRLFILLVTIPLIEIALFVKVGGWLTLGPTLAIVLGTAVLGAWLVRRQGRRVVTELRGAIRDMRDPLSPLAHGAMIVIAGILLMTPGFLTDAAGFALLVPALRQAAIRAVAARVTLASAARAGSAGRRAARGPAVIDADFVDVTPGAPRGAGRAPGAPPSGWTRH